MSDRFAERARRLAGLATRAFGWRPDWFWAATPAELDAVLRADDPPPGEGVTRDQLATMMEQDRHG